MRKAFYYLSRLYEAAPKTPDASGGNGVVSGQWAVDSGQWAVENRPVRARSAILVGLTLQSLLD
jgi:hypothetical protein